MGPEEIEIAMGPDIEFAKMKRKHLTQIEGMLKTKPRHDLRNGKENSKCLIPTRWLLWNESESLIPTLASCGESQ
jgi:hypothetical protein